MRKRTIVASLALAASSLLLAAPAAQASGCSGQAWKSTNWTQSTSYSAGCNSQARIDRYYSSSVHPYYGYWEPVGYYSFIGNSTGTNAGNGWRIGPSAWIWF